MFDWRQEAEILAGRFGAERMRTAIEALTEAYRSGRTTQDPRLDEELLVAAYLAVRFPATQAANLAADRWVAEAIQTRATEGAFHPESLLDLGAGCGAATLAAQTVWPGIQTITAIEPIPAMVRVGRQMVPEAMWRTARFEDQTSWAGHDIVLCSYAYGEARQDSGLLEKAWEAAGRLLILIEPGTPRGFSGILDARRRLIEMGASILAPCPSHESCPALEPDWCHFAARLNRTSLHRRLKGGSLGHEDEKFSYVAAWRGPLGPGLPRAIRHPLIHPGRIQIELCQAPKRVRIAVTKKNKDAFRLARKLGWGDVLATHSPAGTELSARDGAGTETA